MPQKAPDEHNYLKAITFRLRNRTNEENNVTALWFLIENLLWILMYFWEDGFVFTMSSQNES